jgi:SAM-dependent methyltransferase
MDRDQWNERYTERAVWSGEPNSALVENAPAVPHPGARALDLGCGEGADALWLAGRGWHVTGVDWAGVALDRARAVAARAGSGATFVEGDITDAGWLAGLSPSGAFDLVTLAFLHPEPEDRARFYSPLPGLVALGGHVLVIAHDPEHGSRGLPGPPAHRLLAVSDIVAALALPDGFEVITARTTRRLGEPEADGSRAVVAVDAVVLVHRAG